MAKLREANAKTFPVKLDLEGLVVRMELRPYKGGAQEAQSWADKLEDSDGRDETIQLIRERFCGIVRSWDVDGPLHEEDCATLKEGKEPSYAEDGSCALCEAKEVNIPLTVEGLRRADANPAFLAALITRGFEELNQKKLKRGRY